MSKPNSTSSTSSRVAVQTSRRLFSMLEGSEKELMESELLKELETLGEETFQETANERLQFYMESKKVDDSTYYESRYKPLDNDSSNAEEAQAKMMVQSKVMEYGSNIPAKIYDPSGVIATSDELLENILRRSVSKNISNIINRNQSMSIAQPQQLTFMPLPYSRVNVFPQQPQTRPQMQHHQYQ